MLRKVIAYNVFPLLLIVAAFFALNRYKPEFNWKFAIINATDAPQFYEVTPTGLTGLNESPSAKVVYTGEGHGCFAGQKITYVPNALLNRKTSIEQGIGWVYLLLQITSIVVVLDFSITFLSFFLNRVTFFGTSALSFLLCSSIIAVLMLLGPIIGGPNPYCWVELNIQAELTNISEMGLQYFYIGILLAISTLVLIVLRYVFFRDVIFKPKSVQG